MSLDGEAGGSQCAEQQRASRGVPRPLRGDVVVVAERGDHRGLHRRGNDHPGVLADLEQLRDQRRVAGDEAGPVAGEVRSLRQRVHGEQAVVAPPHTSGDSTESGASSP